MADWKNKLYFGDNLEVLQDEIDDESIDLIYLDPPFNSKASYNILFQEQSGEQSAAQITAFEDTWGWSEEAEKVYYNVTTEGPEKLSELMQAFRSFLYTSNMMAYLTMMAPRLIELHRVLKSTGSIYLHCDPTASHYLKLMMDAVFGPKQFRNEIIWRRTGAHSAPRRFGPIHDVVLFYSKTDHYFFRTVKRPYMKGHVDRRYTQDPESGQHKFTSGGNVLTGSGIRNGESGKPWMGFEPTSKNRHWAIPGYLAEQMPPEYKDLGVLAKLDALYEAGLIDIEEGNEWPTPVRFLGEESGQPVQDIWAFQPYTENTVYGTTEGIDADVKWLGPTDPERLGYQTQKPIGLLERIIRSSCPDNGIVLDPFCGCGTTVATAEQLKRRWIGIDITHLSVSVIVFRLTNVFGSELSPYEVKGIPRDLESAKALKDRDRYEFQYWAVNMVKGRPSQDKKKGADKGIDGYLYFDDRQPRPGKVIISVKSGNIGVKDIRELKDVVSTEKAQTGVFITLKEPTKPMRDAALQAGYYEPNSLPGKLYQKIQIITVAELLDGKQVDYPYMLSVSPFKKAVRKKRVTASQESLFGSAAKVVEHSTEEDDVE